MTVTKAIEVISEDKIDYDLRLRLKRLAEKWRWRRDSYTGDSVRDSCADELEKVVAARVRAVSSAMKLEIVEPSTRESDAILICDEHHNDIAAFYHNEHSTVPQSYETALMFARKLVEGTL